ncbi:MAG: hypothetical protein ACOCUO_00410 [archaeon]
MHEHSSNNGHRAQNVSGAPSDGKTTLSRLAEAIDLELESVDGIQVAVENNPDQSLLLLESENASGAIAVNVSELTLAEAIERAPQIADQLEMLARGPVFATDGRGDDV